MKDAYSCNIILNLCGILILLLLLFLQTISVSGSKGRTRKQVFLICSGMVHFLTLCILLAGGIYILSFPSSGVGRGIPVLSVLTSLISALLMICCFLCDESGGFHIPRGMEIPVGQIACAVLPAAAALCMVHYFPEVNIWGIAWSVSLHLVQSIQNREYRKEYEAKRDRLQREQAVLMAARMQPHFIFNTLAAIRTLCLSDPELAVESIDNLSGYLRNNIDALSSDELIPFDEEFRHIQEYIALEQADPARRFSFEFELEIRDFMIPALTIQPVVENAVKHGALSRTDGRGKVVLATEAFGKYVRVTVDDNGTGDDVSVSRHTGRGIGIENTKSRLSALCGGTLQIMSSETGSRAIFLIPHQGSNKK